MTANPYIFDTFNFTAADPAVTHLLSSRLEYGNGVFDPNFDYDSDSKARIFSDLMNYLLKRNDYNTGTLLRTFAPKTSQAQILLKL